MTVRFLSKKLEMPEEEVEYLLDVNPRLLFTDLTKVKLAAEGISAIKRISDGLESRGDIPSLINQIKGLGPHEFRRLEELIGMDQPVTKKQAAEELLSKYYQHPDSVVTYVATRGLSQTAREVFDILWQSKNGLMPVSKVRVAHGGSEFDVEQALYELFRGLALFEMYRFDGEDRLVRVCGLLSEIRQYRELSSKRKSQKRRLKALKSAPDLVQSRGLELTERICSLVAQLAARPARLRGDGDLFREDRRRLADIVAEEDDPSLTTCLWAARSVGWLVEVDDSLRAGELEHLVQLDRLDRHRLLFEWFISQGDESYSRKLLAQCIDEVRPGVWYSTIEFIRAALEQASENEQPLLKQAGGHWQYMSPSASTQSEARLARSLEESLFWFGAVNRGSIGTESCFCFTELGLRLVCNKPMQGLDAEYPARQCEFVVQPNFDIVVPTEDVDPLLTVPLDQFAMRTSTGQATVYHVSKDSFTQAVQEGHDGDAFVNFLLRHNRSGELPANVTMTLEDWRGGMRRVRLRTLHVLESDDPLVIADLMHRRRLRKHLDSIDPKRVVLYNAISRTDLAKELEKDGFIVD
ncbi:MAG: helicase-associated domain-containing protein [Candidatus Hydrogenedentes bacterium]|nr:helicase-associated domain-containing protein [Candidatus Hydrogenedentota bacterium]